MKITDFIELKSLVNVVKGEVEALTEKYTNDVRSMEKVMQDFILLKEKSNEHEKEIKDLVKLVKTGNGEPSMIDDIRTIKKYQKSQTFWLTAIAIAILGEFIAAFFAVTIWVITTLSSLSGG